MQNRPVTPIGINHLVINVRDMAESHRFWTEIVGLKQVGVFKPRGDHGPRRVMQFYSADHDGRSSHHDLALMEVARSAGAGSRWHADQRDRAHRHRPAESRGMADASLLTCNNKASSSNAGSNMA